MTKLWINLILHCWKLLLDFRNQWLNLISELVFKIYGILILQDWIKFIIIEIGWFCKKIIKIWSFFCWLNLNLRFKFVLPLLLFDDITNNSSIFITCRKLISSNLSFWTIFKLSWIFSFFSKIVSVSFLQRNPFLLKLSFYFKICLKFFLFFFFFSTFLFFHLQPKFFLIFKPLLVFQGIILFSRTCDICSLSSTWLAFISLMKFLFHA